MQVKDIGEFRLIEKINETLGAGGVSFLDQAVGSGYRLRLSIGDDAAAWDGPASATVLTTDTLVEDVHFSLDRTSWAELGWKAIAVNLSDIAAMGCSPLYSVVALGLRGELSVEGVVEMYRGMSEACGRFGGGIVGGDVVRSPLLFISVTMIGTAGSKGQPLLTRSAAKPGDKVAVTGSLGCSAGGLRMQAQGPHLDAEAYAHLQEAHNRPLPLVFEGKLLARHGVAAAIDVSDGLLDDLGKLCVASDVGAVIHSDRVPVDEFLRRAYPEDWLSLALSGGEDYQILFAAPAGVVEQVEAALEVPVSVIGDIVGEPRGVSVLDEAGRVVEVEREGWDHFRPA